MALAAQTASETVQLKRHYAVARERVFEAWTDPQALSHWFGPHSHRCEVEHFDLREGGEYRIRMIPISDDMDCGGSPEQDSVCAGQFVQVRAPEKLVMTFTWVENGGDIGETLLSVEFHEVANGTDVVLTHERLPNEDMRRAHSSGWEGSLECLQEYLAAATL
ncbi:MAG: hypothetical protein AMS22_00990 [Thiotrichales bacterium SG8_50]|nr:MAG: hypothetical protein AMS22_00990 [Thiotrichales bacterium SG8_50]